MREHYVLTVLAWLDDLEARWDEFVELVGEEMARVWRLYLVGGGLDLRGGADGRGPDPRSSGPTDGGASGMPAARTGWAAT